MPTRPYPSPNHGIARINHLQQQGQIAAAIAACQEALLLEDNLLITALLGTLYCQNQAFEAGRDCLNKVLSTMQEPNAEILSHIAGIFLLLGEPASALQYLDHAIKLEPRWVLAQLRRGMAFMQMGQLNKAIKTFVESFDHCPPQYHLPLSINLARCAIQLGDTELALRHVEQAQLLGGRSKLLWLQAAVDVYTLLHRWREAENAIQQALETGIAEKHCVELWAVVLAAQDKHDEAEYQLRKALRNTPDDRGLLLQLSTLATIRGHYGVAVQCLLTAVKNEPDNASLWAQLAHLGKHRLDSGMARQAAEKAMELTAGKTGLERAEALLAMANAANDEGRDEEAVFYYRETLAAFPQYVPACLGLGYLLLQWGQLDEAVAQFEAVAARHPLVGHGALIRARCFPDDPETLARIEKMAYIPSLQGSVSSSLLFDLASAYEYRKDYSKAFRLVSEANTASRKFLPYCAQQHHDYCVAMMRVFNTAFFAARQGYGNPSTLPVFVLGMPRSGTTLVEQILGGHPDIYVAGEIGIMSAVIQKLDAWERHVGSGKHYPDCIFDLTEAQSLAFSEQVLAELRNYSSNATHIVDKLPHNFENIGLIRLLFPNAAIIHVLREPRDVAISNFFTDYQAKFGCMGFAYDLTDIGKHLLDYQTLMAHWDATLAKPILTIRYEEVVDNTEAAARKMLAYLGVEWDNGVLDYSSLKRAVKTASVWQVRQPIYKSSKEKWRHYQAFLEPLEVVLRSSPLTAVFVPSVNPQEREPLVPGLFFVGMEHLRAKRSEEAAAIFLEVLHDNPCHAAAIHMLGIVLMQQGKPQAALDLIKQSIALHAGHPDWYHNLGLVFDALGRCEEAEAAYTQAKTRQKTLAVRQGEGRILG